MASKEPAPSSAITGKSLLYQGGGYWAAWSGTVSATDTETTLLEFASPEDALIANIRFFFIEESGDDIMYKAYLNNLLILAVVSQSTSVIYQNTADFIIPGLTNVKVTGDNIASSAGVDISAVIVARSVYGET
jgi:hypothetical protein